MMFCLFKSFKSLWHTMEI